MADKNSKLFVFDVDCNSLLTSISNLESKKLALVIKSISNSQYVSLMTRSNLANAKKLSDEIGLENGYLICNDGAIIYDIELQKVIYANKLSEFQLSAASHIASINNFMVIAQSNEHLTAYSLNRAVSIIQNDKLFRNIEISSHYGLYLERLKEQEIYSIQLWSSEHNKPDYSKTITRVTNGLKEYELETRLFNSYNISMTVAGVSKYHTLSCLRELRPDGWNHEFYISVNEFDLECLGNVKSTLVDQDQTEEIKNKALFVSAGNSDNGIENWLLENSYMWKVETTNQK